MSHVDGVDDGVSYGVFGQSNRGGNGVIGHSNSWAGVRGHSNSWAGVYGTSFDDAGVYGHSHRFIGMLGESNSGKGVMGLSNSGDGVFGESISDVGVHGRGGIGGGLGVYGQSESSEGVYGVSDSGIAVRAYSNSGTGVHAYSGHGTGLYGRSTFSYAAYLDGAVYIRGPLEKPAGRFKIDHPLDPANKYLCHSFVESPDMKNVYDGVVVLDDTGEAEISLPDWFGALNKDFRYQLTAIGSPGANLYIAEEVAESNTNYSSKSSSNKNNNSSFRIAGGTSGMKVSWQVTGIRKDPWANANRIEVEEDKPAKERGYYLHPDLYGQPEEKGISHLLFPKDKREELARAFHK